MHVVHGNRNAARVSVLVGHADVAHGRIPVEADVNGQGRRAPGRRLRFEGGGSESHVDRGHDLSLRCQRVPEIEVHRTRTDHLQQLALELEFGEAGPRVGPLILGQVAAELAPGLQRCSEPLGFQLGLGGPELAIPQTSSAGQVEVDVDVAAHGFEQRIPDPRENASLRQLRAQVTGEGHAVAAPIDPRGGFEGELSGELLDGQCSEGGGTLEAAGLEGQVTGRRANGETGVSLATVDEDRPRARDQSGEHGGHTTAQSVETFLVGGCEDRRTAQLQRGSVGQLQVRVEVPDGEGRRSELPASLALSFREGINHGIEDLEQSVGDANAAAVHV